MSLLYRMGTGNGSGGDLKPYIVQFTCDSGYIGQTLTMTYKGTPHAGETVDNVSDTVASDGTLTLYPMHSGNWECSCYSSVLGTTMKKTIELSYWGTTNVSFEDIPNGATVTPTDDVQTWLNCANIWDKQYTTVSQVVADKTTLNALVQNENANDYLVRSTTFSTTLCENNANNEAMYYLGLYDGCANKLLADDYWSNAICSADVLLADGQTHLFEKVLNVKVPRMTSNTAPSGEVSAGSYYSSSYPYLAFDGIDTQEDRYCWQTNEKGDNKRYLSYKFEKPICVKTFEVIDRYYPSITEIEIFGSNASATDFTHSLGVFSMTEERQKFNIVNNNNYYKYYTVIPRNNTNWVGITTLQFYGREEA